MSGAGEDKPLSGDVGVGVDDGCGPKCESSKGNAEIGDASAGQGAAMKGEESGMRPVMCVCGVVVSIPVDVYIFQCSSCRMTLEVPKPLTDEQKKKLARRALNRWMVREAVSKELDNWLDGKETFDESSTSIVARFYRKLCEFPLFDDKSTGIDKALLDFFLFLPKIEDRLAKMGGNRTTVRTRVVNFIAGPIFYSTFGGQESEWFVEQSKHASSRGEKNDVFKTELVHVLKEIEKPDGASTLLESLESAHSLAEMPGTFSRMEQAHIQSAVANVEHSLAKTKNRSKLKSLYHLTPRRTIIKIMKMNMGNGLATAAVNLFLVRPFGSKSLMQRMACTMLGVSDSEDMALFAGKQLSPEVRARADAYIEFATTGDDSEFDVYSISDQELLYFLGDDKITQKWNCAPVPMNQIENLRANCEAYMSRLQTRSKSDSIESGGLDLSDEDDDEDDEFLVSEDGGIKVKPKDDSKKRDKIKQLFSKRKSEQEKGDRHPLQFLRMYIEEEQHYRLGQILVELLGDEKLEKLIRVSLPIVQKHLISSVTTKGSGLIPLIEGMFVAWKQILKIHKDKKATKAMKRALLENIMRKIHELTFTLVHNLIRGDKSGTWHQLVYWIVDIWNSSKLNIDTNSMLSSLGPDVEDQIEVEAEELRLHHLQNASRTLGSDVIKPPPLEASWKLVDKFRARIVEGLFSHKPSEESLSNFQKPKRLMKAHLESASGYDLFLTHLEVVYSFEDSSSMNSRGYEQLPVDFNVNGDSKSWLWVRRSAVDHVTTMDGQELEWMKPITDVRIIDNANPDVEKSLRESGYFKVAKPLDKRNAYLWYTRKGDQPIRNIAAVKLFNTNSQLQQDALKNAGYLLLAPTIKVTTTSIFGSTSSKPAIGLYVLRKTR